MSLSITPIQKARELDAEKSDSVDLAMPHPRSLYIGGDGDLKVTLDSDSASVTFVGLTANTILPIAAKRIWATGTTATDLIGLI